MSVYNNKEEQKRRKAIKPPADAYKKSMSRTPVPLRPVIRAATGAYDEVSRVAKEGFRDAASRPTAVGRSARGLRTASAMIPAALYGASKDTIKRVKNVASGVGDFATEFMGGDSTAPASRAKSAARVSAPAARVSAPQHAPAPIPVTPQAGSNRVAADVPIDTLKSMVGSKSGNEGTGYITAPGARVILGPDGKITMVGQPIGDPQEATKLPVKSPTPAPARRQATRMATSGGDYRLPDRSETLAPARSRVSDITEPETIGEVPGYRRRVEAARADIAADQTEAQRLQQAEQFSAGQEQQQEQFETGTLLEQGRFNTEQALAERRITGTERQQQLAADQQKEIQKANQRKEARRVKKDEEISAARARFDAADTAVEKVKAAQILNSLQGMKIDTPTKGKSPGLTQKETSEQIQNARKIYDDYEGEAGTGVKFPTWMQQNDPRGFQAAFGNLNPREVEDYNEIQGLSDKELLASSFSQYMNPGETPAQFRQRVEAEFRRGRGY